MQFSFHPKILPSHKCHWLYRSKASDFDFHPPSFIGILLLYGVYVSHHHEAIQQTTSAKTQDAHQPPDVCRHSFFEEIYKKPIPTPISRYRKPATDTLYTQPRISPVATRDLSWETSPIRPAAVPLLKLHLKRLARTQKLAVNIGEVCCG